MTNPSSEGGAPCRGTGKVPGRQRGSNWDWVPCAGCPDCTPPDTPAPTTDDPQAAAQRLAEDEAELRFRTRLMGLCACRSCLDGTFCKRAERVVDKHEAVVVAHGQQEREAGGKGWEETARQYARNAEYYRGLVVEIGGMLGRDAYIADDGTVSEDVLCAKVPELVRALRPKDGS